MDMDLDDISTFDWIPAQLAAVFEDSHADQASDWQEVDSPGEHIAA
ncbi:MAG: hypothetical protein R3292_10380 [Alcanivorax sp.]|nr:hypothetical protein [Alcanivorax sp.]